MVISKKYNLVVKHDPSQDYDTFIFNNPQEVKRFMSHLTDNEEFIYELYEITFTWNMETGSISRNERRITSW